MDLDLPVVDGWEATRRLKASDETRHIPVIAVSSYAMVSDRKAAIAAGCDDFFSKPVDLKGLLRSIEHLLDSDSAMRP
jgi:CheY-like chemotaxis protein